MARLDDVRDAAKGGLVLFVGVVVGVLWLMATVPAGVMALLSPMASDNGAGPSVYVFMLACLALPVTTIIAAIRCFKGAMSGDWEPVVMGSALPLAPVLLALLAKFIG